MPTGKPVPPVPMELGWSRLVTPPPPECDLCGRKAVWQHPAGGLRCATCPRPKE